VVLFIKLVVLSTKTDINKLKFLINSIYYDIP